VNEFRFHIGDYAKHTVHLSNAEDLAYRRALDFYYDTEQPLRADIPWLSHRLRVGIPELEFVLREFFELRETGYHNKRADAEIAKFHWFLLKQKDNGKQGGRPPKKPKETQAFPTDNPTQTQKKPNRLPSTNNQDNIYTSDQAEFEEFYSAYPRKVGKGQARKAYATARRKVDHATLLAAAKRYAVDPSRKPEYTPHPATWLNGERWLDKPEAPTAYRPRPGSLQPG
jgi:uncharacterized protein YdaU (DUF1376 family)